MTTPRAFFRTRSLLSALILEILFSLIIVAAASSIFVPIAIKALNHAYLEKSLTDDALLFENGDLPYRNSDAYFFFRLGSGRSVYLNPLKEETVRYSSVDFDTIVNDVNNGLFNGGDMQTNNVYEHPSFTGDYVIYYVVTKGSGNLYNVILTDDTRIKYPYYTELIMIYFIGVLFSLFVISVLLFIYMDKISKSVNDINNYLLERTEPNEAKARGAEILSLYRNFDVFRNNLSKAEQEKQELFQNISHELKTPITTIKLYADAIQDDVCIQGQGHIEMAKIISTEADNLLYKVRKIMILNKLSYRETNKQQQHGNERINISDLLFEMMNVYHKRAPEVNFVCSLEPLEYRGTADTWKTIFENVFDNNIRHGAKNVYINVSEKYLTIENDGELIEAKILDKIFEPFNRGQKGNFGLGMGIIKQSLELYNYSIKVYNNYELNRVCYSIIDNI